MEPLEDRRMLATFIVTNPGDLDQNGAVISGTLRDAIDRSNANDDPNPVTDTIVFSELALGSGMNIFLNGGALTVTGPVNILGPAANKLTIRGNGEDRVFVLDNGDDDRTARVLLGGMTITGGSIAGDGDDNYGGGILNKENLTIIESYLTGNFASSGGVAVFGERGSVSVVRSLIEGNTTFGNGGGLLNGVFDTEDANPRMSVENSTITGNTGAGGASYGGGLYNARGTVDISFSTFVGNEANNEAGLAMGIGSHGNPGPEAEGEDPPAPVIFTNVTHTIVNDGADELLEPENPDEDPPLEQSLFSEGYNIVNGGNMMLDGSDLTDDPLLVSDPFSGAPLLADFGGVLPTFMPDVQRDVDDNIILISPAIDGGDPGAPVSPFDFEARGSHFTRAYDYNETGTPVVDIGATERQLGVFVVDELYDESDGQYSGVYQEDPFEGMNILGTTYDVARDFTIREALEFSQKNPELDTVTFAQALLLRRDLAPFSRPPTLLLTAGQLPVDVEVIIQGPTTYELEIDASGNDPTPTLNNSDGSRIFMINDGDPTVDSEIEIHNLTLLGGDAVNVGGGIHTSEKLLLDAVTIKENAASNDGGGIFIASGSVDIINTTINGNQAADDGGGIYVDSSRYDSGTGTWT
ncbi:MAG: hypothetical protein KDA61_10735, partial [Planctomycetales bacterium]|nr:hypothetical protein [Planctomycetales bacterium]